MKLVDVAKRHLAVIPVSAIGELLRDGGCTVNGQVLDGAGAINHRVAEGDRLQVLADVLVHAHEASGTVPPHDHTPSILLHDADVIVVDKPAGVHVHPLGRHRSLTILGALAHVAGARLSGSPETWQPWADHRAHPVHRLDRPTSGLLLFGASAEAAKILGGSMLRRQIARTYVAEVARAPSSATGTIDMPLGRDPSSPYRRAAVPVAEGGQSAVTHWEVLADGPPCRLRLTIETGRTHQIRAHLASLGLPILGDVLYGADARMTRPTGPAIRLHAAELSFPHPRDGRELQFATSPAWD